MAPGENSALFPSAPGCGSEDHSRYPELKAPGYLTRESPSGAAEQIYPYVKNTQIYKCASDPTKPSTATSSVLSYAYNRNIVGYAPYGRIAAFNQTAKTVLLHEIYGFGGGAPDDPASIQGPVSDGYFGSNLQGGQWATGNTGGRLITNAPGVHFDGCNYLLGDGHVKWLRPIAVSTGWDIDTTSAPWPTQKSTTVQGTSNAAGTDGTLPGGIAFQATFSRF